MAWRWTGSLLGVPQNLLLVEEDASSAALDAGGTSGETALSGCSWTLWLVDLLMNEQLKLPIKAAPTVQTEVALLACMTLAVDD